MKRGKVEDASFRLGEGNDVLMMPSVLDEPVKCLGRLYTSELSDSGRKKDIREMVDQGLQAIGDRKLQGTIKCWMYQFGLLPRLMWPLIMYEIPVTAVEALEQVISKHLRKWLCVPPGLSSVALYSTSTKLKLPLKD